VKELKISIKLSDIQKEFKMKNTYPVTVQEWLDNLYGYLKTKDFFEGEELEDSDEENVMSSFYDIVGKAALQSWLENGDIRIEEEELTKLLYQVVIKFMWKN
jgi:predicted ATPase with chaperone activity